ncbi:iron chelate uptake ABC transporter family permease subunit, partial [Vibrio cholerae O1]|nr:iron chelate uptake ABC transporter family permease subunit [Vibrio cholerae O1]
AQTSAAAHPSWVRSRAAARGLAVLPAFLFLIAGGIWLVSASITAAGVIGFIGLLIPNIARSLGARTPKME